MSERIDAATVERLARLARLELSEGERDALIVDLARVLELFEALARADVDGVEPMSHPHAVAAMPRADVPAPHESGEALLALAPEARGGYVLVPPVIEG